MLDTQSLTSLVIETLSDNKGQDIFELDISARSNLAERMIVCTATSNRHAKTLGNKVWVAAKEAKAQTLGQEGNDDSGWTLIDLDSVLVHVMLAETREYYHLEDLWSAFPTQSNAD